jgi:FkbM family methyltransferase
MFLELIKRVTMRYYVKGFYRVLWAARSFLATGDDVYRIDEKTRIAIDHNHYYQWMMGSTNYYGMGVRKVVRDILRPGDVFVDVGANIGYFSTLASALVGDDGLVVGFEPDPRALKRLKENVAINRRGNVVLIEKVCSDREGTATFNVAAHMGWSTAISSTGALAIENRIDVEQYVLDNILKEPFLRDRTIRLIKIDVEGYEPRVLAGASDIIKRNEAAFVIEVNHERLAGSGQSIHDIVNFFDPAKYGIYWIQEHRRLVNSIADVDLIRIDDVASYYGENGDVFVVPVPSPLD